MAVKWKSSATTTFCVLCCFFIILPNAFVNCVRVQAKRVKGAKGRSTHLYVYYINTQLLIYHEH